MLLLTTAFVVFKLIKKRFFYPSSLFFAQSILLQIYISWMLLDAAYAPIAGLVTYRTLKQFEAQALLICNCGTFFLLVGYFFNHFILRHYKKRFVNNIRLEYKSAFEKYQWRKLIKIGLIIASLITISTFIYLGSIPLITIDETFSSRGFYSSIEKFERIRPIYNMANIYVGIANGLIIFDTLLTKKISLSTLTISCLSLFITVLTGTRSYILSAFLTGITNFYIWKPEKLKLVKLIFIVLSLMIILGFLDIIRSGKDFSVGNLISGSIVNVFTGNTFTDFRDFAWFLSRRDDDFFTYGLTQICSSLSFLPSAIFRYRRECTYGAFTARTVGLDPDQHFGIRISIFGEQYISFGIIGVILLSLLLGYVLSVSDLSIDKIRKKIKIEHLNTSNFIFSYNFYQGIPTALLSNSSEMQILVVSFLFWQILLFFVTKSLSRKSKEKKHF
jgi:oligosaccharide repeat unit polymerase